MADREGPDYGIVDRVLQGLADLLERIPDPAQEIYERERGGSV